MIYLRDSIFQIFLLVCIFFLVFFSSILHVYAEEIEWFEVSRSNSELLSINSNSIKYHNNGFLSVMAKHTEMDPHDKTKLNDDTFLMAIDCDKRLFSKFPIKATLKQVKIWENPVNNKLVKETIIKSCSF